MLCCQTKQPSPTIEGGVICFTAVEFPGSRHQGYLYHFSQAIMESMGYKQSTPATINFDSSFANWWLWHSYHSGRFPPLYTSNRSPAQSLSWIIFWATLRTPGWIVGSFVFEQDGNRTNNRLDRWHRKFNAVISWPHPYIQSGRCHQRRTSSNWSCSSQHDAGSQPPRRRRK